MIAPLENPIAIGALVSASGFDEVSQWLGTCGSNRLVDCPVLGPAEEREPTVDGNRAAYGEDCRSPRHIDCEMHEFVLISARAVQQDERRSDRVSAGGE
jgi:hypothetical protein